MSSVMSYISSCQSVPVRTEIRCLLSQESMEFFARCLRKNKKVSGDTGGLFSGKAKLENSELIGACYRTIALIQIRFFLLN